MICLMQDTTTNQLNSTKYWLANQKKEHCEILHISNSTSALKEPLWEASFVCLEKKLNYLKCL